LLAARFGTSAVLGGQCIISATLDGEGRILHLNDLHFLSFGEQNGAKSPRVVAIAAAFSGAKFDSQLSTAILQEMWEKWAFIAAAAGICCLMRGAFGDIAAAGASQFASNMFAECCAIAAENGSKPRETAVKRSIGCSPRRDRRLPPRCCATSSAAPRSKPIISLAICWRAAARGRAIIRCCKSLMPICGPTKQGGNARNPHRPARLEVSAA
jgi:hypothetical protein